MTLNIMFVSLISLSFTLPLMMTPIMLGLWILLMSLTTAALLTLFSTSWFGLILFIIYIGGMLVMFAYFAAITPNQKFSLSPTTLYLMLFLFTMLFMNKQTFYYTPMQQSSFSSSKLFSFTYLYYPSQAPLLIFLASLLLMALIFVVKIANRTNGPLRPFV